MRTSTRIAAAAVVVAAAAVLAGCGAGASSSSAVAPATPAPSATQGSLGTIVGLADYLAHLKPVATRIEATVRSLPDAVKGLSKKPDVTWTRSATRLDAASAQPGAEAAALSSLTPPQTLRPVQKAAVQGLKGAQTAAARAAAALNQGAASGESSAQIRSQIDALEGRLTTLGERLLAAVEKVIFSPGSTPTP